MRKGDGDGAGRERDMMERGRGSRKQETMALDHIVL